MRICFVGKALLICGFFAYCCWQSPGWASCLGINFPIFRTLLLEVVFMDRDFRIADLSAEKVAEINEFQKKLRNETNQNIVLIAYEPGTTK